MSTRGQLRSRLEPVRSTAPDGPPAESGITRVARKARVSVIEGDALDDVLQAMLASPGDAYWARRLVDLVRDPMTAWRLRSHLASAVCTWASHDPSFFVHERYLSEQLAVWAWPREVFEELEMTMRLDDPSLTHLVMGRLWLEARRSPDDLPEFYARAARHLREVKPHLQVGAWPEAMSEALGVADPSELALRAEAILDAASPLARDRALLAILRGAARAGDWELYDAHRRVYGASDVDGVLRSNSELAELDGKRAEQNMILRTATPLFGRGLSSLATDSEPVTHRPPSSMGIETATVRPPSRPR
ncbi:MAG TPA: hypothetical protein VM925_05785 [Labilithrix sp.]|nr:hypothetical protein [Labilithrix sp.]